MEIWKKNLYTLWAAQFLTMIGMNLVIPFLPFYVRHLGVTDQQELAMWSGLAFAGTFMSSFIATPIWGSLGDRHGKKMMVVRAIFGLGLAQIFVGFSQDVYQLFFFRIVQGAISGFIPAAIALVSSSTPKEKMGYSLGFLQSATAGGAVFGPFVGGILADFIGYRDIFFIVAGLCFISGLFIMKFVHEVEQPDTAKTSSTVFQNYKFVFGNTQLRLIAITIVIGQASALMIESIFALFIEDFFQQTAYVSTLTGIVVAISGLFMFIAAPWWGKRNDKVGYKKNLSIALGGTGVFYAAHMLVPNLGVLMFLRAGLGFVRGGILHSLFSLSNLHAPADRKSGLMGIASSMAVLGNMLGPLIGGYIASQFGITTVFAVNSIMLLISGLMIHRFLTEVRVHEHVETAEPIDIS
ncbi:MAG: MFS transporter [Ignavibacteriales bacterium]|nr:MFS transporter [Ignavibacteriales bacterium]